MRMSNQAILSIVVAVLFLGSIFGMALGTRDAINTDNNNDSNPNNTDSNLVEEMYMATIDTNVLDIYPQLMFTANTDEFDLTNVEEPFRKIDGIKDPQLNFSKDQNQNIILTGRSIIESDKKIQIIQDIKDINYLSNVGMYQSALVSLPQESITLTKSDANITKDYEFTTEKIEGIVSESTQKDDEISAQLQVSFKGNTPTRFLVLEYQNLSSNPQMVSGKTNLEIKDWIEEYRFEGIKGLDNAIDQNQITDKYSDYNLTVESYVEESLKLDSNKINLEDANTYLFEQKDQNIISEYDVNQEVINIMFSQDVNSENYLEVLDSLNEFSNEGNYILEQPIRRYQVLVNQEDLNITGFREELSNDLIIEQVYKKAEFDASNITIDGTEYTYPQQTTSAWLYYPEDLEKEEIELNAQAFAQRKELMFISLSRE